MRPIVILGAMAEEVELLKESMTDITNTPWHYTEITDGTLFNHRVILAKCGVGKVLSAILTQHLIDTYQPTHVICTGVAGALNPEIEIGDIIVATDTMQHDMDVTVLGFERGQIPFSDYRIFQCDPELHKKALSVSLEGVSVRSGRILSGDQFVTASHAVREIMVNDLYGDAVEMEGASIGLVCHVHSVPYLIIRSISDKADEESHIDFQAFVKESAIRSKKIVLELIKGL